MRIICFIKEKNQMKQPDFLKNLTTFFLKKPLTKWDICGTSWSSFKYELKICLKHLNGGQMPGVFRGIWLILLQIIQISSLLEKKKKDCNYDKVLYSGTRMVGWMDLMSPPQCSGCQCHLLKNGRNNWVPSQHTLASSWSFHFFPEVLVSITTKVSGASQRFMP